MGLAETGAPPEHITVMGQAWRQACPATPETLSGRGEWFPKENCFLLQKIEKLYILDMKNKKYEWLMKY